MQISEFDLRQPLQSHQPVGFATSRHDIALHNHIERRKARMEAESKGTSLIARLITKLVGILGFSLKDHGRASEEIATFTQL